MSRWLHSTRWVGPMGGAIGGVIDGGPRAMNGPNGWALGEALRGAICGAIGLAHGPPWRFGRRRLQPAARRLRRSSAMTLYTYPSKEGEVCLPRARFANFKFRNNCAA